MALPSLLSGLHRDNRRMLGKLAVIALLMFGFGYALVPMYKHICEALGIPGKGSEFDDPEDEIEGAKVWDAVAAGRIADVARYCNGDVERTRLMHKRMIFEA